MAHMRMAMGYRLSSRLRSSMLVSQLPIKIIAIIACLLRHLRLQAFVFSVCHKVDNRSWPQARTSAVRLLNHGPPGLRPSQKCLRDVIYGPQRSAFEAPGCQSDEPSSAGEALYQHNRAFPSYGCPRTGTHVSCGHAFRSSQVSCNPSARNVPASPHAVPSAQAACKQQAHCQRQNTSQRRSSAERRGWS